MLLRLRELALLDRDLRVVVLSRAFGKMLSLYMFSIPSSTYRLSSLEQRPFTFGFVHPWGDFVSVSMACLLENGKMEGSVKMVSSFCCTF